MPNANATNHDGPRPCSKRDGRTHLVVIQPSSFCNINCSYCYVPGRDNRSVIQPSVLTAILECIFVDPQVADGFRLVWHNGEPLALGQQFYRDANATIERVNVNSKSFYQCIQTNGTLIDPSWIDLFTEFDISPSISIDGPQHIHDRHRVTRSGNGSHAAVMKGVSHLRENGFPLVGLCVITNASLKHGREIMQFFIDEGFSSLGLIIEEPWGGNPITSFSEAEIASTSFALESEFQQFIADVYDIWYPHRESIEIREFQDVFNALRKLKLDANAYVQQEDTTPLTVLSFDREGGIATFSPQMIAGTDDDTSRFIVANISDIQTLESIRELPRHSAIANPIASGVELCSQTCGYYQLCGGGAPASKFYEHGRFDCTETRECRYSKQLLIDSLLELTAK